MTTPLLPCPECSRHVRASETCCPFCRVELDRANTTAPLAPGERLGRGGLLGFQTLLRAGLVAATSAALGCDGGVVAIYGAPDPGSGGTTAGGAGGGSGSGGTKATGGSSGSSGKGGTAGAGATAGTAGKGGAAGGGGKGGSAGSAGTAGDAGDAGEGGAGGEGGR